MPRKPRISPNRIGKRRSHESLTSPRRIQATFKQRQALELRIAGRHYDEIARVLGLTSPGAIYAVKTALRKTLQPAADEYRALTLERLTKVLSVHWPTMLQGDPIATRWVLETITDIRELLGLDAPIRQVITGPQGGPLELTVHEMRTQLLEQIKVIEGRMLPSPSEEPRP